MVLEGVGVSIGETALLAPLTLSVPSRGVTGLVGQNGSGKSTLLKLLARQQMPTRGTITFGGRSLHTWRDREFARAVAFLPQHTPLTTGLTVRELIGAGRYPWHGALGRFSDVDRQKVDEAMALTSTASLSDRFVDTLSGGERQRAWLAMLIAQDARLLLLDEPLSALDVAHQLSVMALVRRLTVERDLAVLIVLHDINLAARYCDEIVALKNGRMVARGSPEAFMTPGRLEDIYDVAMDVFQHPEMGVPVAYVRS
jgi:iron complex transport system ATP-binding protein